MTGISRRQSREIAFQFLYGNLPEAGGGAAEYARRDFELFCASFAFDADEFAWELCDATGKNVPMLDKTVAGLSTNWRLDRMSRVDLTILRLAALEILVREDIPKSVSINEAVELAKRYGAEDSPAFVNGLLDKIDKPS